MYIIIGYSKHDAGVKEYVVDTKAEMSKIGGVMGTIALCLEDMKYYIKDGKGEWREVVIKGAGGDTDVPTLEPGLYEKGAIALWQNNKGSEAVMRASWDEIIDSGALTLTDGALSMGTGIIGTKLPDNLPELNEYGFYYGVTYGMTLEGMTASFVFNEDGSAVVTSGPEVMDLPVGVIIYGDHSIDLSAMGIGIGVVSDDASTITFADAGMQFTLGETVTIVGVDIVLPTGGVVTSIPDEAFDSAPIAGIMIAEGVTSIGNHAFEFCDSLVSVNISDSVTNIGEGAFYACRNLTSINIPSSITNIGTEFFRGCSSLTNITIEEGITSIGEGAFTGCTNLVNICIPSSITNIDINSFQYCSNLTNIVFNGTVAEWGLITKGNGWNEEVPATQVQCSDGVACIHDYIIESGTLIETGEYEIKYTCTLCGETYTEVTSVSDLTVTKNNRNLVGYTSATKELVIPEFIQDNGTMYHITKIGSDAFKNCKQLTSVELPGSTTDIYRDAFAYCDNLTSVYIPDGVTNIAYGAFAYCINLTNVNIPNSVKYIGALAFQDCAVTSIVIPEGVPDIDDHTFAGCKNLVSITIPNSVIKIERYALSGCSNLTSIKLPDDLKVIGESAFSGCKGLENIDIPDSVTSIGNGAFQGCTGLTSIEIPSGITTIGANTFTDCTNLINVSIPDGVTSIGDYAFFRCVNLKSIELPKSVVSINYSAFHSSGLTSINIPEGVTLIDRDVFNGCTSLTDITFEGTVDQWYAISKGSRWNEGVPATYVQCSDGQVTYYQTA